MSEKLYNRLLLTMCIIGVLSVIALTVYTYILYKDCSIISYIANRG